MWKPRFDLHILNTLFETKAMESQDFRTFKQENLICTIYMKSRLWKARIAELLTKKF